MAPGAVLRAEHLGLAPGGEPGAGDLRSLADVEREHVSRVLRGAGGNRTRAAEILGISRPRLRRLIDKYRLE